MTQKVPLTKGKVALVDDDDFDRVMAAGDWRADSFGGVYYARRAVKLDGRWQAQALHRFLLSAPVGVEVDHANRNPLDNRRRNLRLCSRAQNCANARYANRFGFRGVYARNVNDRYPSSVKEARNGFYAGIRVSGRLFRLGRFDTPDAAAVAYDRAASAVWGEFATLNFPTREPLATDMDPAFERDFLVLMQRFAALRDG